VAFALQGLERSEDNNEVRVQSMLNIFSISTIAGVFAAAVNFMCAFSPATLIQILGLTTTM
jgi:hypothetical protein